MRSELKLRHWRQSIVLLLATVPGKERREREEREKREEEMAALSPFEIRFKVPLPRDPQPCFDLPAVPQDQSHPKLKLLLSPRQGR